MTDFDTGIARRWAQIAREDERLATQEAAKALLALLPEQTLDEIGWDWDTHHMAGAITPQEEEVVMLWFDDDANLVICAESAWRPDELTPTGNRYTLAKEDTQPEPPTVLRTVQDFEDAPSGTIVAERWYPPHMRLPSDEWWGASDNKTHKALANSGPWTVLRWGWAL